MIRLTGGDWRGRTLVVPPGIRPTTELARKAAFDILGESVKGARVLDAAAGSGAFGLEALSRGAASVVFVEKDRAVAKSLAANVAKVDAASADRVEIRIEPVSRFLAGASRGGRAPAFDLVFHDPPYADDSGADLAGLLLLVAPGGTLVAERGSGKPALPTAPAPADVRRYGATWLHIFHTSPLSCYARGRSE